MRFILIMVVVGVLFLGGVTAYLIRTAPHTPIEKWHVDPLTAPLPPTPNFWRVGPKDRMNPPPDEVAPVYRATAEQLAAAFEAFVVRQRDTQRIAGRPADLFATYVQRTEVLKFPDYISVRFIDLGEGRSTLALFSRSRYGYGDMGVNKARAQAWLAGLEALKEPAAP